MPGKTTIRRCVLFLVAIGSARAADLSGSVMDPSRGVIPNAKITIRNPTTQTERTVFSNAEGLYSAPFLAPGPYDITAEAPGFRTELRSGVRLEVGQSANLDFILALATVGESIAVNAETTPTTSDSAAVSTVITRQFIENLPMNGRSFQSLIALTPGVVLTNATFGEQGQFSVNGQRADANYFTIDGVGANVGVSTGLTLVQSASGSLPGLGANGGTNTLVSVDALQEFRVETSTYAAEYGRTPGAQIMILTRSGSNQFHGTLFDFFRNDALDANDWFVNADGLSKPALRQNDFGGVLGGPILKNRTFFFFSYEGLRLLQPQVEATDVPSLAVRSTSPASMQPYLDAFPLPNGPASNFGFAPFTASYSNGDSLDATSIRIDQSFGERLTLFGRYNYAPSVTTQRLFALNDPTTTGARTETLTLGATLIVSPRLTNDLRLNYSLSNGQSYVTQDGFGGATPIPDSVAFPPFTNRNNALVGIVLDGGVGSSWYLGTNVANSQHQYNLVDTVSYLAGSHQLKAGFDYRHIGTWNGPRAYDQFAYFTGATGAAYGEASELVIEAQEAGSIRFDNVSLFAQDAWKIRRNLTLTYGLRWELNPAPTGGPNHPLYTFTGYQNPAQIQLASAGTPLYQTTWTNFAPRIGAAWQLLKAPGRSLTLRGGWGMFYDLGAGIIGQAASSFPYYQQYVNFSLSPFPVAPEAALPPPFSLAPPVASIYGAVRGLQLPVTREWNVALERELGEANTLTVSWVGAAGRRLLRMDYFVKPNDDFIYAYLLRNTGFSNFESLQAQFRRRLSKGLQALISYTWAHSLDNASTDSASYLEAIIINPQRDYGSSDFDIRHALSAAFSYNLPGSERRFWKPVLSHWSFDGVYTFRTATPVDITYTLDTGYGTYSFRPDVVPGVPLYLTEPNAPGGRIFNPAAFTIPDVYPGRQGTLGRNVLRGFPLDQINFTLRREFPLREWLRLQLRAEMFNALNHPNFGNPVGAMQSSQFGYSTSMLNQDLGQGGLNGGLNPLYQLGGPRSIQLALRLVF
jgi:hypothetical protein